MNTVLDMFGVATTDELPEKVRDAMLLKDYGKGKPLTARRIIAVAKAISQVVEPASGPIGEEKARSFVDGSVRYLSGKAPDVNMDIDENARRKAAGLLVRHGAGLTDNGLLILSNYVTFAVACGKYGDGNLDAIAERMANYFKSARNFFPGDVRMAKFDAKMTKYWQDTLSDNLNQATGSKFDADGLSETFIKDSDRSSFKIAGEEFALRDGKGGEMIAKFKSVVVNPAHRKALSAFMNQNVSIVPSSFANRNRLVATTRFPELDMIGTEGFDLFLSADIEGAGNFFEFVSMLGNANEPVYGLEISEDGTKAKVTIQNDYRLLFNIGGSEDWFRTPMGNISYKMEFDFDLSNPAKAELTASRIGQTFEVPAPQV